MLCIPSNLLFPRGRNLIKAAPAPLNVPLSSCLLSCPLSLPPSLKERGNTPLHVASQAGQAMQVELLIIHGANPCTLDGLGHTPEECARSAITSLKRQTLENLEPMAKVFSLQLMPHMHSINKLHFVIIRKFVKTLVNCTIVQSLLHTFIATTSCPMKNFIISTILPPSFRIAGHHQLADRLIEMQYELADKLSFFLCGRKPMHSMGEHYLIPNVAGRWATIRVLSGRKTCCFFGDRQVINANE